MEKFVTAVNCIDGRVQLPVINYVREKLGNVFVDMVTIPGADGILSNSDNAHLLDDLKNRLRISIEGHKSRMIFVVGHYDYLGNPVCDSEHIKHIKESVKKIKQWFPHSEVRGLWVDKDWKCREV